ncbi:hypothetical protein QUF72_05775 [Desulfobacterales bacterium HSG2]|nr:hypothetical protein [Desulfobacterales bacterium HSG2]
MKKLGCGCARSARTSLLGADGAGAAISEMAGPPPPSQNHPLHTDEPVNYKRFVLLIYREALMDTLCVREIYYALY